MSAQVKDAAMLYLRPLRVKYDVSSLIPEFELENGDVCPREDFVVKNLNGKDMPASVFRPKIPAAGAPVCIFAHGNAMNQGDSMSITPVDWLLEHGIAFCAFDFAGCGNGGEEYLGLGFREKSEIGSVVDYVRGHFGFEKVVLWGLSMGAFAAILTLGDRSDIAAAVIDSACTSLHEDLEEEMDKETLAEFRQEMQKRVGCDIYDCDALKIVGKVTIPVCFVVGKQDNLVPPENGERLYKACPSAKKTFLEFDGGHNSVKRFSVMRDVCRFIYESLGIQE